jgi:hypothetical protein
MGGEPSGPTYQHATLDTWCSVQNRRRRNLRRGHISALYKENHPTTQHILDHIQQQTGSQSTKLSDYVGYDDANQCYGHAPRPINKSEHGELLVGMEMDCGRMEIWRI